MGIFLLYLLEYFRLVLSTRQLSSTWVSWSSNVDGEGHIANILITDDVYRIAFSPKRESD